MLPRLAMLVLAVAVARVGLASRHLPEAVGEPLEVAMAATFVVTLVLLARPRIRPATAAVVGFSACAVVELAQLTGLPQELAARWPTAAPYLGLRPAFSTLDLVWYAGGAALGATVGTLLLHAIAARRNTLR